MRRAAALLLLLSGSAARNSTENAIATLVAGASSLAPSDDALLDGFVRRALILKQSLDAVGSAVDHVAIVAHVGAARRATLSRAGWCVRDFSALRLSGYYHPIASEADARAQARRWGAGVERVARNGARSPGAQARRDGAATYYKFVAWTFRRPG